MAARIDTTTPNGPARLTDDIWLNEINPWLPTCDLVPLCCVNKRLRDLITHSLQPIQQWWGAPCPTGKLLLISKHVMEIENKLRINTSMPAIFENALTHASKLGAFTLTIDFNSIIYKETPSTPTLCARQTAVMLHTIIHYDELGRPSGNSQHASFAKRESTPHCQLLLSDVTNPNSQKTLLYAFTCAIKYRHIELAQRIASYATFSSIPLLILRDSLELAQNHRNSAFVNLILMQKPHPVSDNIGSISSFLFCALRYNHPQAIRQYLSALNISDPRFQWIQCFRFLICSVAQSNFAGPIACLTHPNFKLSRGKACLITPLLLMASCFGLVLRSMMCFLGFLADVDNTLKQAVGPRVQLTAHRIVVAGIGTAIGGTLVRGGTIEIAITAPLAIWVAVVIGNKYFPGIAP